MCVQSPSLTAGLAAWQAYLSDLEKLEETDVVLLSKKYAKKMIEVMTLHPNGVSIQGSKFKEGLESPSED